MATRGRPRAFDRDQALARAMEVFWTKGYEGAQLVDLTAAMGINPPSFYAAFGSKEAAFREAVELYIATVGAVPMRAMEAAPTAREGIRAMLEGSVDVALSSRSGGCLLVLGVINCLDENQAARELLKGTRRLTLDLIRRRLDRGVRDGDLAPDADIDRLAAFFLGMTQAISFQARDGAGRDQLMGLIPPALTVLDAAVTAAGTPR